jgi:hypothetical protein
VWITDHLVAKLVQVTKWSWWIAEKRYYEYQKLANNRFWERNQRDEDITRGKGIQHKCGNAKVINNGAEGIRVADLNANSPVRS